MAGLFARRLSERQPQTRLLGFRAPFALATLYEPLRCEAFDGHEEPSLLPAIQAEPDLRERLRRLLQSLAQRRGRPCAVVLEAMRQNLLFTRLRSCLTPTQDHLLRAASLYRVPVTVDGLLALVTQPEQCEADRQALLAYALLEGAYDPELGLDYVVVPPIVRELLREHGFSGEAWHTLHHAMGQYHRFQGEHVSRLWSDDVEAIYHFRQAGEHVVADEMARGVSDFYYNNSHYSAARDLTEEIVPHTAPAPPWWALNRYGMCQHRLGVPDRALDAFQHALPLTPTRQDEGTTLNNLSQLFDARGDYETALGYLEQSLAIRREIGDKAGEGTTLYNMGYIAWQADDAERAVTLWLEAFSIARETQNAQLLFHASNTLGQVLASSTRTQDQARPFLHLAVEVGQRVGFPEVQEVEAALRRLPTAAETHGGKRRWRQRVVEWIKKVRP